MSLRRCEWAETAAPEYTAYHDEEWGVPVRTDDELFERLCLEAFQSGLSWLTILRKRPAFRLAFSGFHIASVADFDASDRARLLADAGIVRNRAKIDATIANARTIRDDLEEGLCELLWSFAPRVHERPVTASQVASQSPESVAMAKALKLRGLVFIGPTTAYALMQATGIVDDHVSYCWRAQPPGAV